MDANNTTRATTCSPPPCPANAAAALVQPPTVNRPVSQSIHRQVCSLIRKRLSQLLVDVHTEARGIARIHCAVLERVRMREHTIRLFGVAHVFLNAEVVDAEIEMKRGGHADRTQIRRAVCARLDLIHLGKTRNLPQMRDATGVNDRRSNVVDELFFNEPVTVENRVEDLADSDWRRCVLPNDPECLLRFGRCRIFEPPEVIRLETLAEPAG